MPSQDFCPSLQLRGINSLDVFGDPRPATAAKGEALLAGIVTENPCPIGARRARDDL